MNKIFAYHSPSPESLEKINKLREAYSVIHSEIAMLTPLSREKALAFTYLENSAMWAVKAIIINDESSKVQEV